MIFVLLSNILFLRLTKFADEILADYRFGFRRITSASYRIVLDSSNTKKGIQ